MLRGKVRGSRSGNGASWPPTYGNQKSETQSLLSPQTSSPAGVGNRASCTIPDSGFSPFLDRLPQETDS